MVGAGAYMAGVSRLTLSLAVIVMEMTNEVHFLLPLLMAIMVAKWIADALEHALYHSLLETKNIPFLPAAPFGGSTLEMLAVEDIMCKGNIVTVKEARPARPLRHCCALTVRARRRGCWLLPTCCAPASLTPSPSCALRPTGTCMWA